MSDEAGVTQSAEQARLEPFARACCHWQSVYDDSTPDPEGAVRLHDHFSATIELRIAEIQPQYGLVQLNAERRACGCLVSCDVKRDDFLAAVAQALNVTVVAEDRVYRPDSATTPEFQMHHGVCPSCREHKFIGHGPLCSDCVAIRPACSQCGYGHDLCEGSGCGGDSRG